MLSQNPPSLRNTTATSHHSLPYLIPYLIPKSLSETEILLNSFSKSKVIHLQWIPGHSSLPGNDLADSLAKIGASLDPSKISVSLAPLISSQRQSALYQLETQCPIWSLSTPNPSSIPRSSLSPAPLAALSRLRCNGHSTLLNSYLHRVGRAETPLCINCGSKSQDLSHLVLDCPVLDHLRQAIPYHF